MTTMYPWTHLFPDIDTDVTEDDIVDTCELSACLARVRAQLSATEGTLASLRTISGATFKEQSRCIADLTQQMEQAASNPGNMLRPVIMTRIALAHKQRLDPTETQQFVLDGVYKSLKQRQALVKYLMDNNICESEIAGLNEILLTLTKEELLSTVSSLKALVP
jgi:hypothetical protein